MSYYRSSAFRQTTATPPSLATMLAFSFTLTVFTILNYLLPTTATGINATVILPESGAKWPVGSTQSVAWTYPPDQDASGKNVSIFLGGMLCNDPAAPSRCTKYSIANLDDLVSGVPFSAGAVNVTVPDIKAADNYIVYVQVFPQSGNVTQKHSSKFSIVSAQ